MLKIYEKIMFKKYKESELYGLIKRTFAFT
jgi:hypothetical protein